MKENVMKEKAFGIISLSKMFNGGGRKLFMSSIDNPTSVVIRISQAEYIVNEFGEEKVYHDGLPIIEVELSASQFSEFLLNNVSEGTPCTIRKIQGENIPLIPTTVENQKDRLKNFYKNKIKENLGKFMDKRERVKELMSKKYLTQEEKNEINDIFGSLKQELSSNIPFWLDMFEEGMDKIVNECKKEIDSAFQTLITKTGIEALKQNNVSPIQIENKEEE